MSSVYDEKAKQVVINIADLHGDKAVVTDIESVTGVFNGIATVSQILSDAIENNQPLLTPYGSRFNLNLP